MLRVYFMNIITRNPFLFLLVGIVFISFSPVLVLVSGTTALKAGLYRHLFGLLFLLPFVLSRKVRWYHGKWTVLLPVMAGVLFFVDLWSWHIAIGLIGPGLSTLIGNFQVFFVTLIGVAFLRERPPVRFYLSIPLALTGVYFIGNSADGVGSPQLTGMALCLLAALCYAFFLIINRKSQTLSKKISAEMNLLYMTLCAGTLFALAVGASGESYALPDTRAFAALFAYGLFPHFIGWIIIIRCLPLVNATVAGMTLLLQPVLTFVWEVLLLGRQFEPLQLFGGALAVAAIYLGTMKSKQAHSDSGSSPECQ
jgi:drug/metabolite transporter (DMT)-like permease